MNILKDRLIIAYGLNDEEIDKLNIKFKYVKKSSIKFAELQANPLTF